MPIVNGNALGIFMFMLCGLVAGVGGGILRLSNPVVMFGVGLALLLMDGITRWKQRTQRGWLWREKLGGSLFWLPVWILGILVMLLNVLIGIGVMTAPQ